jgi:hypothetical protein
MAGQTSQHENQLVKHFFAPNNYLKHLMPQFPPMKLMLAMFVCASLQLAGAQTNVVFQNCRPGDLVKVKCDQPLVVLGKATLLEIGSNTVTVCTASDRFTLDKTNVILVPLESHATSASEASQVSSAAPPISPAPANTSTVPPSSDILQTMESIRASVIDPHKMEAYKEPKLVNGKWEMVVDPNSPNGKAKYDKANAYYHDTMTGVMNGSISQDELVRQAKAVLSQCDKYAPERKDDPQYEKQIETLRDFVRRSEAGEKIDFGKPVQ